MGFSKSHGCRTMRQLRAKGWLYEDASVRGRSVIRVNLAKAEKVKVEWQARVAIERETQSSLLANMTLKASHQSPAESIAQNAANVSTHEQENAENIMQMAVGQTFVSAMSNQWETCGKTVGNFGTVPPAALQMAQSVPPAAPAVPSAAPAVPPAAPTYIQYKYNKNSNVYSTGRSPFARGRAQAAQQGQTHIKNFDINENAEQMASPAQAPVQASDEPHTPTFTIIEEIDLTVPRRHHNVEAQPQAPAQVQVQPAIQAPAQPQPKEHVRPQEQPQDQSSMSILDQLNALTAGFTPPADKSARAQASKRKASSEVIGYQDVLDAVTALDDAHGYAQALHASTAALAGEIMAHYTAGGRNWRIGQSRTTKQTLPDLCQRYLERALEHASSAAPARASRSNSAHRYSSKGYTSKRSYSSACAQNSGDFEAYAGKVYTPAAGYEERPDNFNLPPAPGELTDGEKIFGRNEDILAALAMGGAQ